MILNGLPKAQAIITTQDTLTYSDLEAHIVLSAEKLHRIGPKFQDNLAAFQISSSPIHIIMLLALIRNGMVACPLSSRLPEKGLDEAIDTLGALTTLEMDPATFHEPDGTLSFDYSTIQTNEVEESKKRYSPPHIDPKSPSLAVFTSGSSGSPKAVILTMANIIASASAMNQVIPLASGDRWLLSLPLYHVGGLSILFRCFHAGAAVVIPDENQSLLDTLKSTECTHLSLVATQLYRLMQDEEGVEALVKLKAVMLGGGAVPESLIRQAMDAGVPLHTSYGMTETAAAISCTSTSTELDDLLTSGHPIHPDTIGITEDGRIQVSGPTLFQGYLVQGKFEPVATKDGWFTTSDLGYLDDAGRVHITGRADNMMISGGENIQPEEIEAALCAQPGVIRAVVVPESDAEFGQRPIAFVDTEAPLDAATLKEALRKIIPGFNIPKRIEPWPPNAPEGGIKANRAWFKAQLS